MQRRSWHSIGLLALASALALGAAALGAASGCSTEPTSDVVVEDAGVYEARDASVATCPACVENACAGAWALCLTSASCLSVRACATASGCDGACAASCACKPDSDGGTEGGRLYRAYAACNDAHRCDACASDCGSSCADAGASAPAACNDDDAGAAPAEAGAGGDAATAALPSAATCGRCTGDACSGALQSCGAGSECAAWLTCADACNDDACRNGCDAQHATGKAAALELASCAGASCHSECGL